MTYENRDREDLIWHACQDYDCRYKGGERIVDLEITVACHLLTIKAANDLRERVEGELKGLRAAVATYLEAKSGDDSEIEHMALNTVRRLVKGDS